MVDCDSCLTESTDSIQSRMINIIILSGQGKKTTDLKFVIVKKFFALLLKKRCAGFFSQLKANHVFMVGKLKVNTVNNFITLKFLYVSLL